MRIKDSVNWLPLLLKGISQLRLPAVAVISVVALEDRNETVLVAALNVEMAVPEANASSDARVELAIAVHILRIQIGL